MRTRKQLKEEQPRSRILIISEGTVTEPQYFRDIKGDKELSRKLAAAQIVVWDTSKNSHRELVALAVEMKKAAEKERNPYDQIWVVVDRDGYTKHPEAFNRADSTGISIAFSSPCFEYWLLLHYEYSTAGFHNCDAAIEKLKGYISGYKKGVSCYHNLKHLTQTAITNSERVMAHWNQLDDSPVWERIPYTNLGKLVAILVG